MKIRSIKSGGKESISAISLDVKCQIVNVSQDCKHIT